MEAVYCSTRSTFSNSDPLHCTFLIYCTVWFISLFWQHRILEGVGLYRKGFGLTTSQPSRRTIRVFASTDLQAPPQGSRVISDIRTGHLSGVTATPNNSIRHAPLFIRRHIRLLQDGRTCIRILNIFLYLNITKKQFNISFTLQA